MAQTDMKKLDAPTRVKLRSSQILTSLPQIVSELIQNSIDAGAAAIDIGVDCEEWLCWVKDDGSGITKEGLSLLASGSEEGRYGSSKTYQPDSSNAVSTFGFRGEALASAADLGCLEISSRTAHSRDTWSIITKDGKCLYSGPAVRWRRETPGTVVCIRDAFYNLPVRRLSHLSPTRTLDQIRQELETYSIIFPHIIFSLENTHEGPGSTRGRVLRIPKTSSSLNAFRNLYGRALAEHVESIDFQSDDLRLEGFISLDGAYSKGYQFLCMSNLCLHDVNRHPIARCDLHQAMDVAFGASTFGKNALDEIGEIDLPRSNVRRAPRKSEKKAVYVLNITVPSEQLDNCIEPAKAHIQFRQKDAVLALLSTAVTTFLTKHGFIISGEPSSKPGSNRGSPAPRKRRKIHQIDDSGFSEAFDSNKAPLMAQGERDLMIRTPVQLCTMDNSDEVQQITWTDPRTGETFIVDPRTGNSYPQAEPPSEGVDFVDISTDRHPRRTIHRCVCTATGTQNKTDQVEPPEWLQKALQANRTYEMGENLVQKVSSRLLNETLERPYTATDQFREFRSGLAGLASGKRRYCFRKEDLRRAIVINQVDTKFIACLIEDHTDGDDESLPAPQSPPRGHVLVLIDQHAADERIRVERFLNDLCSGFLHSRRRKDPDLGVQVKKLSPPLPVLLTLHEAQRLNESLEVREAFRSWGFQFDLREMSNVDEVSSDDNSSESGYTQVRVKSIPEVVSDKLLLGDELRNLIKGFLGQLETDEFPNSVKASMVNEDEDEFPWLKALRWCPRGLLDLINSKACRGAIMFNDSLGISQCEDLIRRLSDTAFPFQCAHGRPSVVPLTNLGMSPVKNKGSLRWSKLEEGALI